jgi:hypothetical protein
MELLTDPSLFYMVRVADIIKDDKATDKPDAMVYSAVAKVLKVEMP